MNQPRVVSRETWLDARKALLAKEKDLTRLRDRLAAERRALPWVRIEKQYVFDGPQGPVTLADLFSGCSQLFVKHFMMAPGQVAQCVGLLPRGRPYRRRARAPARTTTCRTPSWLGRRSRRSKPSASGWGGYSRGSRPTAPTSTTTSTSPSPPRECRPAGPSTDYEYVHPGLEDRSGDSVFVKDDAGQIFHTYSTYGRGGEEFLGVYRYLDATPRGRGEDGPYNTLADWVRPREHVRPGRRGRRQRALSSG